MVESSHKTRPPRAAKRNETTAATILGALAIVVGSALLGLLVNHYSPRGIPLLVAASESQTEPALALPQGVQRIGLEGIRAAFESGDALLIDARPAEDYAEAHIPGAVSLPAFDFDSRFPELIDSLEAAPRIIVYCSGVACSDSIEVAERLTGFGFEEVSVFEQGFSGWDGAGLPTTVGAEP